MTIIRNVTGSGGFQNRVIGGRGVIYHDERDSGGVLDEHHTLTCAHCNRVVELSHEGKIIHGWRVWDSTRTHVVQTIVREVGEPGFCWPCNARLCDNWICNHECKPVMKTISEGGYLGARGGGRSWVQG